MKIYRCPRNQSIAPAEPALRSRCAHLPKIPPAGQIVLEISTALELPAALELSPGPKPDINYLCSNWSLESSASWHDISSFTQEE